MRNHFSDGLFFVLLEKRNRLLDAGLTKEVTGSTPITKATILYVSEESVRKVTSPGLDTSHWPQDDSLNNGMHGGTLAFIKSEDKKTMAYNPFGRGDGKGTWIPDIWVLQDEGARAFPEGTWLHFDGNNAEKLEFTASKLTIDSPYFDTVRLDYTVSGNTFVCTNREVIPYVPTTEDLAEIAAFDEAAEAAFRRARPWIPATSTITPTATKVGVQYRVTDEWDDNASFVNDSAVSGTWTTIDYVRAIDWFDPEDRMNVSNNWIKSITFHNDGNIGVQFDNSTGTGKWTKGLVKTEDGASVTVSKYEIKTIVSTAYLFLEDKSGDYISGTGKPSYFVLQKE